MVRALPWARALLGLIAIATVATLAWGVGAPVWLPITLLVALLGTLALGVFRMDAGLFARPILRGEPHGGRLALTFDDGPDPEHTRRVLAQLARRGHRATFFVIGDRAAGERALLDEIVAAGHSLANHSLHHARTTAFFPVEKLAAELGEAQAILQAAAGKAPRWFRPPAGVLSPRVVAAAESAGVELVGWTASARDGIRTDASRAARRLQRALRPGAILVLHDGAERRDRAPIAAEILELLLPELEARGLRSVTLDELLDGR